MFSRHPWKMIVGWISAVSTDRNSCEWCCWHAGSFPCSSLSKVTPRFWRKLKIRWSVHRSSWSLCRSSPTAVWIQATKIDRVLSEFSFSRFASSIPRLFRCTQPIWERQSDGRRLGNGRKIGCRRHRSELRHQVIYTAMEMTPKGYKMKRSGPMQDWSLRHAVFQPNPCGLMAVESEWLLSTLDKINDEIHESAVPPTQHDFCSLVIRMSWSTASKAAVRSSNPSSVTWAESAASRNIRENLEKSRLRGMPLPCL